MTDLIECKLTDTKPHKALQRFAAQWPSARSVQLVRDLRHEGQYESVRVVAAAGYLAGLSA